MMNLAEKPHRRYNPLTEEWVLCSPHRTQRPWLGQVDPPQADALPPYDPGCYLCPGNERAGGRRNPRYDGTYVFDNDFPALLPTEDAWELNENDLLVARAESGVCRVVCFSPRHDLTLPRLSVPEIRAVVNTWVQQFEELGNLDRVGYVLIFENKGAMMGCSNPHPHCQIWATRDLPTIPARKLASQERYYARHGRDMLGDYLRLELEREQGRRVVRANEHWVALVPFWAVWPFETMLVPRRRVGSLPALTAEERDSLAEMMKGLTARFDNLFQASFPYTMAWHAEPTDGSEHPCWRLHAIYQPPLLRSASVRKFLVGYEMNAEPQRDITPETAAARLREASDLHYLEKM